MIKDQVVDWYRIMPGLGSIVDKVGGGLEFLKNLSPVQNIINAVKGR